MKYNLKNVMWTIDPIKARKDFEEELREQLAYGEKCEKAWRGAKKHRVNKEIAENWEGSNHKIKEILGE